MAPTRVGNRLPALDGLRGIAVLLVLAFHCRYFFPPWMEKSARPTLDVLGWSGVDLFFVLSGYLITGILLDTKDSSSYFRTFYARRSLRIFPLYFSFVAAVLLLAQWRVHGFWYLTYLSNWQPGHGVNDGYLSHLWSLAIEEQFYLIWPAVVWFVPPGRLKWICIALAVTAAGLRPFAGSQDQAAYRLTPCRMDSLALGAFVAIGMRHFEATLRR